MKRILSAIVMFLLVGEANADIKYNDRTNRFYSLPISSNINQEEYHNLFIQIGLMIAQCSQRDNTILEKQIYPYLTTLGTPTAMRLLDDIKKPGIKETELYFGLCAAIFADPYERAGYKISFFNTLPDRLNKETCLLIMNRIAFMVITFWNGGVYGDKVKDQVNLYVKNINSPEGRYLRGEDREQ